MTESKHTPGPWEVGQHPAVASGWIVKPVFFGNRARALPECEGGHVLLANEADARLIASAPELLAALEAQVMAFRILASAYGMPEEDIKDCTSQARAALAQQGKHNAG